MYCRHCVLPETIEGLSFDEEGVCDLCRTAKKKHISPPWKLAREAGFLRIIERFRGKRPYDCLVMCSGGKDSTAALYYAVRRYGLRPLAYTFDLGYETTEALENTERAVNILGVDWIVHRTPRMKSVFAEAIRSGSKAVLCHLCSIHYVQMTFDVARRFGLSLVIAGWTRGQVSENGSASAGPELDAMSAATAQFVEQAAERVPEMADFPRSMGEATRSSWRQRTPTVVSPHWFLPGQADEYRALIERELGWRAPRDSYPAGSTNCLLNYVSSYLSLKNWGYTHYHVEMSKLIRRGEMTRDEALAALRTDFPPELLDRVVGMTADDIPSEVLPWHGCDAGEA